MTKKKYYVVWEGAQPGIYDSWEECKRQTEGSPNPRFMAFNTEDEAQAAFGKSWKDFYNKKQSRIMSIDTDVETILESVAVDASCLGNPGLMEYRGVYTNNGKEIFRVGGLQDGTNNIGEFLAIVHALALLKQRHSDLPVYTDSRNAMLWVQNKKAKTKLQRTDKNGKIFELIERAEKWLNSNTYENKIMKWETDRLGEIPADFGRK